MKALRYLLIFVSSIIALGIFVLWYIGLFDSMQLEKKNFSMKIVAGINFKGSYQQIGPVMGFVDSALNQIGISSPLGFGIYYNDPNTTPEEDLESFVGKVIEEEHLERVEEIKALGLDVDTIPSGEVLTASIPIRSQMSYMLGPVRAYPALEQMALDSAENVTLVFEFYNLRTQKIEYNLLTN